MPDAVRTNEVPARTIRKFNPGTFQSDAEIVRQFVVRRRELGLVLEVLRGNIDSPSCQHVLVIGPRGRGKTMLLARAGVELRSSSAFSGHLFPVRFTEESQEIFTLADFWLEALFHLANASANGNPKFSQELRATHSELAARWRDTNIEECARAAVLEAADRLDQQLVLMVENLQALCGDDEDFGWKLRQTLQSDPQIMLLATATTRFKGLDDASQPFFEQFRIVDLEPLDIDSCRRLWTMASGDGQTNREMKPLQILTGGNPRLLIIVATFSRHRSLRQLLEDLVALIDDHTDYFRNHLEGLAKTERRVYLAVIDLWQPSSAREIAARARMNIRTVSALIGRLVKRGAVLVEGTGRKRKYVAAERLYSIYYKLRRERDEAELVRNLIRFMAVFYRGAELAEMAGALRIEAAKSSAIREGLERALTADSIPDLQMEVARALFNKGVTHGRRGEPDAGLAAYDDLLARFGASELPGLQVPVARALFNKALTLGRRGEPDAELAAYDDLLARFGASELPDLQGQAARALLNKGVTLGQRGEPDAELAAYDDLLARFGASELPDLQGQAARALLNKGVTLGRRGELDAGLAAYDDLLARFGASELPDLQGRAARALFNKALTLGQRGEPDAELAAYDDLLARFGASELPDLQVQAARALFNKGVTLGQRGELDAGLAAYDDLLARFGASELPDLQVRVARALFNKALTLGRRGEPDAELAAHDDLLARFGASELPDLQVPVARALLNKGVTLGRRGEPGAALAAYDDLLARFGASELPDLQVPVARALLNKGVTLGRRGEPGAELAAYDDLLARFGASELPDLQGEAARALFNKGVTLGQRGEPDAGLAAYDDLLARFGASELPDLQGQAARALLNKGVTLGRRGEPDAELAAYDDLLARFGASELPDLQMQAARALLNKGVTLGQRGEPDAELAAYDDLLARFGTSELPDLQGRVARALFNKGDRQIMIGRAGEAIRTSDELDRRFGATIDNEPDATRLWRWRAKLLRTNALVLQEEHPAALDVFQSVCAMFIVGNETMLSEMLRRVPMLIAAGVSRHGLVRVLSANSNTAAALAPLIVALRLLAGESVRASEEVRQVADDVRNDIEEAIRRVAGRGARKGGS